MSYSCAQPLTCACDYNNLPSLREGRLGGIYGRIHIAMRILHELMSLDIQIGIGSLVVHCEGDDVSGKMSELQAVCDVVEIVATLM